MRHRPTEKARLGLCSSFFAVVVCFSFLSRRLRARRLTEVNCSLSSVLEPVRPHVNLTFDNILAHINTIYVLKTKSGALAGQGYLRLKVSRADIMSLLFICWGSARCVCGPSQANRNRVKTGSGRNTRGWPNGGERPFCSPPFSGAEPRVMDTKEREEGTTNRPERLRRMAEFVFNVSAFHPSPSASTACDLFT